MIETGILRFLSDFLKCREMKKDKVLIKWERAQSLGLLQH